MGRDSQPKERQARALMRKRGRRPPYERVLIVSEGSKSERFYFEAIRKQRRLPSVHIRIVPSLLGTECKQVIDSARLEFEKRPEFDRVFAVFDRDSHLTFAEALEYAAQLNTQLLNSDEERIKFVAIPSVPCFELWLLLHFENVVSAVDRKKVYAKLSSHYPGYEKSDERVYSATEEHLHIAIRRAKALQVKSSPYSNPYTRVNEIVELLNSMSQPNS